MRKTFNSSNVYKVYEEVPHTIAVRVVGRSLVSFRIDDVWLKVEFMVCFVFALASHMCAYMHSIHMCWVGVGPWTTKPTYITIHTDLCDTRHNSRDPKYTTRRKAKCVSKKSGFFVKSNIHKHTVCKFCEIRMKFMDKF